MRPTANAFDRYLLKLSQTPLSEHTEHTGRSALEGLLNEFAAAAGDGVTVQHEPKRAAEKGRTGFQDQPPGHDPGLRM